ncbi:NACHT domain-containing protein [Streptomyces sp. Ag109_G2-15]|uniref:NACHT domain-containing protein n=1 Tax=Streptomyces sp. Ag109_G2-15 TaxID=1938850 RepID=UPI000BCEBB76|nr:NACHT domain-containing protein [Streptomyces sp. Ag109_G2-15]SOD85899.1 NACHT domain-containing protein [Streptomyces sp. Ag109_G2-15]
MALATDHARQVNVLRDNYAPIYFTSAPTPTRSLHQLPQGPKDFSGRTDHITAVESLTGDDGPGPHVIDLYGTPGVGKSALAVHMAHRLAGRFDEAQLYADLGERNGEPPTAAQILQRFVGDLDPATLSVPVGTQDLPQRYRSLLAGRRCMILLDNAQSTDQVADLIPATATCLVLVTSRVPLSAIDGVLLHHVDLMSEAESLTLLAEVSQRHWSGTLDENAARTLVQQCGRLPLALRIAGALLKRKRHWTVGKLADVLTDERTRLAKLADGSLDVRGSFEISYRGLHEDEAHAFRVLSQLPLSRFEARHAGVFLQVPEARADELLELLVDAQLVETSDGVHFRYHDLLKLFAREYCETAGDDCDGEHVARFLDVYTSDFLESYRSRLLGSQWSGVDPVAFPGRERRLSAPDALYIPQRLTPTEGTWSGARHAPWQEVAAEHRKVLVLGGAGTGKTVLADRICYEVAARHDGGRLDVAFTVPLRQRAGRPRPLERLIADSVGLRHDLELSYETLELLLTERRTLIIFDGLDELSVRERDRAQADVARFCARYPRAEVVVFSRPGASVSGLVASEFAPHTIDALAPGDVRTYLSQWARATHMPPSDAERLLTEVTSSPEMTDWLATPLLLAQLAAVYERHGHLPHRLIDLYDSTYTLLFGVREQYRGISRSALRPEELGQIVCRLAYRFVIRPGGSPDMAGHEFVAALRSALRHTVPESYGSGLADELLTLFSESDFPVRPAPATASDTEPRWTLVRDPFGQYLAARYIARYSREWEVADTVRRRVMKAVGATGFVEGAVHAVRLLDERVPSAAGQLVTALEYELGRTRDPDVRKSLEQILNELRAAP